MMPSPTATATRRGSFAGDGLASSAKASSAMSPGDGRVAGDPRVCHRAATRSFPGAIVGMKPPQFAAWMFQQLGARAGDELVDLYPGSGAITEAWRRYTGNRRITGDVGDIATRGVASSDGCAPAAPPYDLAVVCQERALTGPVNGAPCESIACIDVGCTAENASVDAERAA